jgi:hypothetical protein
MCIVFVLFRGGLFRKDMPMVLPRKKTVADKNGLLADVDEAFSPAHSADGSGCEAFGGPVHITEHTDV